MKDEIPTKICKTCGRELPLDCFTKQLMCKDNNENNCKECRTERIKKSKRRRDFLPIPWYLKSENTYAKNR